jgi:hypothetical protein
MILKSMIVQKRLSAYMRRQIDCVYVWVRLLFKHLLSKTRLTQSFDILFVLFQFEMISSLFNINVNTSSYFYKHNGRVYIVQRFKRSLTRLLFVLLLTIRKASFILRSIKSIFIPLKSRYITNVKWFRRVME